MAGNSFGEVFRITTFGESHGPMIGVTIDGFPPGVSIDTEFLQREMDRRRPGQSLITTQRKESDAVTIVSGVFEGKSTGTPLTLLIPNEDQKSKDYDHVKDAYRPSHADYTYDKKYGFRDYRGGGRSSARETAARVAAGALAKLFLKSYHIHVAATVSAVGPIKMNTAYSELDLSTAENNLVRCADPDTAEKMIAYITEVRKAGDTVGGVITCLIKGVPSGLGEPVFDKLHADLGKAMLSINAVHGFEYGSGFAGAERLGSQNNDIFYAADDPLDVSQIRTRTNHSGGIQGGISNGEDIYFNVAFKPVATLMQAQETVDKEGLATEIAGRGRHDPCVVPRAVPIVEAMAALVIADHWLRNKMYAR